MEPTVQRIRIVLLVCPWILALTVVGCGRQGWSEAELATLRGMWIGSLPSLSPDPSNAVADDARAVELGHQLFFDTRLSVNGEVACATCHLPERGFQDGVALGQGVGTTARRTMPIAGTAYSPWLFWDGRKDSLWAQALGPLESPVEHGGNRTLYAHLIARYYAEEYEALFGPLPDLSGYPEHAGPVENPDWRAAWQGISPEQQAAVSRVYANLGKAIAAYERQLQFGPSRFDRYVEAVLAGDEEGAAATLTEEEIGGLRIFIGRGNCTDCHNGPLLTNNDFHNTGVPAVRGLPEDHGRALGVQQVVADEFNCLGPYSDATPQQCSELRFLKTEGHELERQFKPPSLRNVAERAPYMHAGQFRTLEEVLDHYNRAPDAPHGHSEVEPLGLSDPELAQLAAFLRTLTGPLDAPPALLAAPSTSSPEP
jgi:cytochrome c peroxidase